MLADRSWRRGGIGASEVAERGLVVAEHAVHRALNRLLVLLGALAQVLQGELVLLLVLRIHVLGVVRARCPLVSICVLSGVRQAVGGLWRNLHFPPGGVSSLALIHWVRAQTFYLASGSTIEAFSSLPDSVYLHLVGDFDVLEVWKLEGTVFVQVRAHLGGCLQSLLN